MPAPEVLDRLAANAVLGARVWAALIRARWHMRSNRLPDAIRVLAEAPGRRTREHPRRLARAVDRSLRLGRRRANCLVASLVLFRLLREQGDDAVIVIGLPAERASHRAHAWVEVRGIDVGPPPGSAGHEPLARFG